MTSGASDDIKHLEQLIAVLIARIQVREIQIAQYGSLNADPHIVTDKQEAERQLTEARSQLRQARSATQQILRPYVGLATFQEEDAPFFFGRETLIAELVQKVQYTSFLTVLGPSGSGKSSVVRAGLIPALKNGILPGSEHWQYLTMRPTKTPLKALEKTLTKLLDQTSSDGTRLSAPSPENIMLVALDSLLKSQDNERVVLVVDQAEELWATLPVDADLRKVYLEQQQQPFIRQLLTASEFGERILVLLTMRADFLHRAAEHHELAHAISRHNVIVSPMRREELHAAIIRPAAATECSFEPGLVDELIEQTMNQPGALPLLEYTLQELWVDRQPDGTLTWAGFHRLGGVEGAVGRRADKILEERYPTIDEQEQLRSILLSLIQPGEGIADTRRRVALRDVVTESYSTERVQALLKPLVDERLITMGRDQTNGEGTIEVSHEALIHAWPTLNEWLHEYRADLRFQIQLEEAAREWATSNQSEDFLWSGLRLANAMAWHKRSQLRLNERATRFLNASYEAEARRAEAIEVARREREQLLEAQAAATVQAQAAAEREAHARVLAEVQARAGEALFDLSRGNTERALLLARAAVIPNNTEITPLPSRALRRVFEDTVPNRSLYGHIENINIAVWSPNGQQILTGSDDKTARIWDTVTGQQKQIFKNKAVRVIYAAWSPNQEYIAVGYADGVTNVWDVKTGELIEQLKEHKRLVTVVRYSSDGTYILTAGQRDKIHVYHSQGFLLVRQLNGHSGRAGLVLWSPNGHRILSRSAQTSACIWDIHEDGVEVQLHGHVGTIRTAVWSPDGQFVLTGSDDKTVRIWDATSGTTVQILNGHMSSVWSAAWSPDGRYVVTGSADQTAHIWDATSGTTVQILNGHMSSVWSAAWSPDGRYILTTSSDRTTCIWETISGTIVAKFQNPKDFSWKPSWHPHENQILMPSEQFTTRIFDMSGITSARHFRSRTDAARIYDMSNISPVQVLRGHTDKVRAADWSPDGRYVITGSADSTARIWDIKSHTLVQVIREHKGEVWAVAWSIDGHYAITAGDDGRICLWETKTRKLIRATNCRLGQIKCVAWLPHTDRIIFGGMRKTAYIWDITSDILVQELVGHQDWIRCLACSPDGRYVITGSADRTARVWDITTGQTINIFTEHFGRVSVVSWHPQDQRVLTAGADGLIRVWEVPSGHLLHVIEARVGWIRGATWSLDGRFIVAGGSNGVASLWDTTTQRFTQVIEGHTDAISSVAWSPDDQFILTSSDDTTVRISIIDLRLIIAEITRRVCNLLDEEMIRKEIPDWRGRDAELDNMKEYLAKYDALRSVHSAPSEQSMLSLSFGESQSNLRNTTSD